MAFSPASRSLLPGAFLAALLPTLLSCSPPARRAVYYWKTAQGPSLQEIARADQLGADRLYVRMFDVESKGAASPALTSSVAERWSWTDGGNREIVPVVYVVNDIFAAAGFQPAQAAGSLLAGVSRVWGTRSPAWKELQVDCDWTASTRAAYFALLAALRQHLGAQGKSLSATIRLHQVKYRNLSGVPPVDRGMLMAYNLLPPNDAGEKSAILDVDELEGYLASVKSYPLALDAALPMFSWVIQWEGERLIGLIDDARAIAELAGPGFARVGPDRFVALDRGSLAGRSVEKGDVFVIDRPGPEAVRQTAVKLCSALRPQARWIALYHLDSDVMDAFTGGDYARIEAIYDALGARSGRGVPAPRVRSRPFCRRSGIRGKRSTDMLLVVRSGGSDLPSAPFH